MDLHKLRFTEGKSSDKAFYHQNLLKCRCHHHHRFFCNPLGDKRVVIKGWVSIKLLENIENNSLYDRT